MSNKSSNIALEHSKCTCQATLSSAKDNSKNAIIAYLMTIPREIVGPLVVDLDIATGIHTGDRAALLIYCPTFDVTSIVYGRPLHHFHFYFAPTVPIAPSHRGPINLFERS